MPLFFPLLAPAGPVEIIAHRVVWSLVVCGVLLLVTGRWRRFVSTLRNGRRMRVLAAASALVLVNWLTYVYAVMTEQVIEAALGYFINPLVTAMLGVVVLKERIRNAQWIALVIATIAVIVMSIDAGGLPWIALVLAASFALYSLAKNRVGRDVDAIVSLGVETALAAPFAFGFLIWLTATGASTFGPNGLGHAALLAASGVITATPLLLFGAAARRLPLTTLGFLQYVGPSLQFLVGLLVMGEQMSGARWIGFALIWASLVFVSLDAVSRTRSADRVLKVRARS